MVGVKCRGKKTKGYVEGPHIIGQMSDPNYAWKKLMFSKITGDNDDDCERRLVNSVKGIPHRMFGL